MEVSTAQELALAFRRRRPSPMCEWVPVSAESLEATLRAWGQQEFLPHTDVITGVLPSPPSGPLSGQVAGTPISGPARREVRPALLGSGSGMRLPGGRGAQRRPPRRCERTQEPETTPRRAALPLRPAAAPALANRVPQTGESGKEAAPGLGRLGRQDYRVGQLIRWVKECVWDWSMLGNSHSSDREAAAWSRASHSNGRRCRSPPHRPLVPPKIVRGKRLA